jgi:hypothetical protein
VLSYRIEHVMGELNYWTDLMARWELGWIAGRKHKAHGKMAILFAQPYISPPEYDTVKFPCKEFLLPQKSAVNKYKRYQQMKAAARRQAPPQKIDGGGMRMMNNTL